MLTPRLFALPALLLVAVSGTAQSVFDPQTVLDPETGLVLAAPELAVAAMDLADGWLELTPLASEQAAARVRFADRRAADGELRLSPGVGDGAAMLCTGGKSFGVLCEQIYVQNAAWVAPGVASDIEVRFEPGVAVRGRYLLEAWPIAGARVAVVPAGLEARRAFTMPLDFIDEGSAPDAVQREVVSDRQGRFALPPLAEGEYFLETILPSGRVHRSERFELPSPTAARRQAVAEPSSTVVWELGAIDVADGLVVELRVTDSQGQPLSGARVSGRQGETPETLINYEATTDPSGTARLSGFSAEEPVHVSCRRQGYLSFRQDYPLLPVLVSCVLEPLAAVSGEVIGIDGLPPAGGMVSLERLTSALSEPPATSGAGEATPVPAAVDVAGRYAVTDLAAGEYELTAAAPGFEIETRHLVLEPGQRLELEAIVLLFGREASGRVVDAETREPLQGVGIRAVSPPGAVDSTSDEDGTFTFASRSGEDLVLRLEAATHASRQVTITASQQAARQPLTFTMERGGWIRAVVLDGAGDLPCQSCRLLLRPSASELVTDGFGEATSEPLSPGWYRLYRPRLDHLGSTVIEQDDAEVRQVRVRPGRTSVVRFDERRHTIRIAFRPAPGAAWTLSAKTPRSAEKIRRESDGTFLVRRRPGQSVDLYLQTWDPSTGSETEIRQATVSPDHAGAELVLPLHQARARGLATSAGEPLAGARVRLKSLDDATWATARTRPNGSFSIPHVPSGVYAVVIGNRTVTFVSLGSGQSHDLGTFELIAGGF